MVSHPILTIAHELQPLIREHLAAGDQRARLTKEVVTAVGQAGLFRLLAPREVGGLEVPLPVAYTAIETIGAADPSVGWYMGNSIAACIIAASLPVHAREELFAEPDRNFGLGGGSPGGQAVPVDSGYRVSGRWATVTGCEDAKWCALPALVIDGDKPRQLNGAPDARLFLVPTTALDIIPTWQEAAAMRGTASNAVSVHEVFVPEDFAHTWAKPLVIDRPLFRIPFAMTFLYNGPANVIGVLSTTLQSIIESLSTKVASLSGLRKRDLGPTQELIANSEAAIRAARAGVVETLTAIWETVSAGEEIPLRLRASFYASCFYALETGRDIISHLYTRGTRVGFLQGNPAERALRNIHTIVLGFEAGRIFHHSAGRVLLGGEPLDPSF